MEGESELFSASVGLKPSDLLTDDRAASLRQATACCEAALRVYTEQDFPPDWAMTQYNLGNAHG